MARILELCLSPDLGGLELYMKNLTQNIGALAVISKKSKLKIVFEKEKMKYLTNRRYDFLRLAKIIDENEIDVVHLHWTKDILICVLAKIFSKRKPKIVQTRHMHMTRFKSDFYHKFLYKNIDLIIAVTNLVKEQLQKFIPKDIAPSIRTCYIGVKKPRVIDEDEKKKLKDELGLKNTFTVCIVGRIEKAKGQHIVLSAVEKLRANGIDAKAVVVGGCMNEKYLSELKAKYKDDIFLGHVLNPTDFMQICDCVVLATQKETFGMVLIEAMRCEICTVASDSGGPTEIIDDTKNGFLFKSFNDDDLYEKLLSLQDRNLRLNLAKKGKEKADIFFSEEKHVNEILDILNKI